MDNKSNDAKTPGVEAVDEIDIKNINSWLSKDLDAMISLLSAIRNDEELRMYMAGWFHGRIGNWKLKEELARGKH